ncbi:oxidoreductase domain-containing protein [Apodospora peruviana]|uniref:Oxidoreductase domain-containing protein n=1 Tax=Apodospora peruviana TaxID=516989 RepID=A0AAE0I1X3_9PEZI|nr:oxidoreductase domain-containing protein [Apodospora peruviana]
MPSHRSSSGKRVEEEQELEDGDFVKTSYESRPVPIPDDFLTKEPHDARPITVQEIDWSRTKLPENKDRYAVVLDHVLSPSECETLLRMAEESVADRGKSGTRTWRPALVNVGGGWEALDKEYRNSDRIIWDNQAIMDRLWERCARADGIREKLAALTIQRGRGEPRRWEFSRFNQRMRFLKYTGGQFFRPHCDGPYAEEKDGKYYETYYTVHLYLNDSVAEVENDASGQPEVDLVGGATSFLSADSERKVDVNPRAGRVLIFQHKGLYHSGDDVVQGTKYTMRTDIMYVMKSNGG